MFLISFHSLFGFLSFEAIKVTIRANSFVISKNNSLNSLNDFRKLWQFNIWGFIKLNSLGGRDAESASYLVWNCCCDILIVFILSWSVAPKVNLCSQSLKFLILLERSLSSLCKRVSFLCRILRCCWIFFDFSSGLCLYFVLKRIPVCQHSAGLGRKCEVGRLWLCEVVDGLHEAFLGAQVQHHRQSLLDGTRSHPQPDLRREGRHLVSSLSWQWLVALLYYCFHFLNCSNVEFWRRLNQIAL